MSPIVILAALILSLLICLGLVYLSFKSIDLEDEEDVVLDNGLTRFELLPFQMGYSDARGWR